MKKLITGIISFALALTAMAAPWGQSAEGVLGTNEIKASAESSGDYEYELLENGTVAITYYRGSESKVTIPSKINGKKVTYIGPGAFMNCTSLTSLTIPNGVTDIGYGAFLDCEELKNVVIPASVKNINAYAFYACFKLQNITLSSGLKTVGELAFGDCWKLSSVSIPKSVSTIGDLAFGYRADYYDEENNIVYYNYVTSFKIKCYANSKGEAYAKENKFSYSYLDTLPNVSGFKGAPTSSSSIKLSWNKVSGANGYIIYQYNNSTKAWVRIAKTNTTANTYTVSKLKAGVIYKYAVKPYKTLNKKEITSASYPQITVSTNMADVTGFKATSASENTVNLKWNKVSYAKGYIIYQYDASKKSWVRIAKTTTPDNTYTVNKLKAGKTYKFAIKAYKTLNGKEVVSKTYPKITAVTNPADVTGFKASTSSNSIKLTWNKASGADGYIIYRYNTSTKKYERIAKSGKLSFTDNKLGVGKSFKYAIRAYKVVNGKEILSKTYPVVTASTNLENVTGFKASSNSESTIKLTWNKTNGADGYIVYRYNTSTKKYSRIAKAGNLSYTDQNLVPGTNYKYAVRAYKTVNGKEVLSKTYPEITQTTLPADVKEFKASAVSESSIELTWKSANGADGYIVYRYNTLTNKYERIAKAEDLSYTDQNLVIGTSYKYAIRAYKTVNGKEILSKTYPSVKFILNNDDQMVD